MWAELVSADLWFNTHSEAADSVITPVGESLIDAPASGKRRNVRGAWSHPHRLSQLWQGLNPNRCDANEAEEGPSLCSLSQVSFIYKLNLLYHTR